MATFNTIMRHLSDYYTVSINVLRRHFESKALIWITSYIILAVVIWVGVIFNSSKIWPAFELAGAFSGVLAGLFSAIFWAISAERMKNREGELNFNVAAAAFSGSAIAFGMIAITFPDNLDGFGLFIANATHLMGLVIGLTLVIAAFIDEWRRADRQNHA